MTKVEGTDDIYEVIPAPGEIAAEGTLINKFALLKDTTAGLFGFPPEMWPELVPDDVFAFLSKSHLHWWKRRVNTSDPYYVMQTGEVQSLVVSSFTATETGNSLTYYTNMVFDAATGKFTLDGRKSTSTVTHKLYWNANALANSYYQSGNNIYYIGTPNARQGQSGNYYQVIVDAQLLTAVLIDDGAIGDWEYISSPDRNAYPDSGISGVYEYLYLGVPFENARDGVKIKTGSYVGTGVNGESTPNILELGFKPYLVIVHGIESSYSDLLIIPRNALRSKLLNNSGNISNAITQTTDNGVSWYVTGTNNSANQLNSTNVSYGYVAIG